MLREEKERDSKRREEERKEQKPEWVSVEMVEAVQRANERQMGEGGESKRDVQQSPQAEKGAKKAE